MKDLFEAIGNLLVEFTWKRFIGFLVICLLILVFLVGYERYTNSMHLGKIEKNASILRKLQEIDAAGFKNDQELKQIYNYLKYQLSEASNIQKKAIYYPKTFDRILLPEAKWKFLTGGMVWWFISIIAIVNIYQKKPEGAAVMVFIPMALVSGLIGVLIPNYDDISINYLIYPIINGVIVFLFIGVLVWIDDMKKRIKLLQSSKQGADSATPESLSKENETQPES